LVADEVGLGGVAKLRGSEAQDIRVATQPDLVGSPALERNDVVFEPNWISASL
jgi:hypothetical protein